MLSRRSEDLIRERYPDAVINPGILLGYDKTEDYNRFHRPYWEALAQIIDGVDVRANRRPRRRLHLPSGSQESHLALGSGIAQGRMTGHSGQLLRWAWRSVPEQSTVVAVKRKFRISSPATTVPMPAIV